jgi:hypothetical protein
MLAFFEEILEEEKAPLSPKTSLFDLKSSLEARGSPPVLLDNRDDPDNRTAVQ